MYFLKETFYQIKLLFDLLLFVQRQRPKKVFSFLSWIFWKRFLARLLSFLLLVQGPGGSALWAVGLEGPLWVDYESFTTSFLQQVAPEPWSEKSFETQQIRIESLFGNSHALSPEKAREILGLNVYQAIEDKASNAPFRKHFDIAPLDEEVMPFFQAVGGGLWHRLMTGQTGIIPEVFFVLFEVPFQVPVLSTASKRGISQYKETKMSYVVRVSPHRERSLSQLRQQGDWTLPQTLPLQALFLSGLVGLPDQGESEGLYLVDQEMKMAAPTLHPFPFSYEASSRTHFLNARHSLYALEEWTDQSIAPSLLEALPKTPEQAVLKWLSTLFEGGEVFRNLLTRGGVSVMDQVGCFHTTRKKGPLEIKKA